MHIDSTQERTNLLPYLLAVFCALFFPLSSYGADIKTTITCRQAVTSAGTIELEIDIRNEGTVSAYNVGATVFLADRVKTHSNLGENLPGEKISLRSRFVKPGLNPGKYVAVIRVSFEEQSGVSHRAYNVIHIPYYLNKATASAAPFSMHIDPPRFNQKVFWKREKPLRLSMQNSGSKTIHATVGLYLPDGFSSPKPLVSYTLNPGEKKNATLSITRSPKVKSQRRLHLVAWYDLNRTHYSHHMQKQIHLTAKPVYLRIYIFLCLLVLGILLVVIMVSGAKKDVVASTAKQSRCL